MNQAAGEPALRWAALPAFSKVRYSPEILMVMTMAMESATSSSMQSARTPSSSRKRQTIAPCSRSPESRTLPVSHCKCLPTFPTRVGARSPRLRSLKPPTLTAPKPSPIRFPDNPDFSHAFSFSFLNPTNLFHKNYHHPHSKRSSWLASSR